MASWQREATTEYKAVLCACPYQPHTEACQRHGSRQVEHDQPGVLVRVVTQYDACQVAATPPPSERQSPTTDELRLLYVRRDDPR